MADPIIPTPQDKRLLIQDTVTKTASYTTPPLDLGAGYAPGGPGQAVAAVVHASAVNSADGDETYAFTLQESVDNITYVAAGAPTALDVPATVAVKGRIKGRYVRLVLTVGGSTPSITFKAWLNPLP